MDSESLTGHLWERVLNTEREMAWDVFLLYGAEADWVQEPPQPDFWMHQLFGVTKAPRLDQPKLKAKLQEMLEGMKTLIRLK